MASIEVSNASTSDVVANGSALAANSRRRRLAERLRTPLFRRSVSPPPEKLPERTTYLYDPLDDEKKQVRLLTLLPGSPSSVLRVLLNIVSFNTKEPPTYEALSYTWGSSDNPVYLTIGETGNDTIAITQNLAATLPYLRYRDRPRVLWIDAICVNQMDLVERGYQVQLMGDIYRLAVRVIAWVGPEADDSLYALKTLEQIGTGFEVDWHRHNVKPAVGIKTSKVLPYLEPKGRSPLNDRQQVAIRSLVLRPWFERLWVQQEIKLADAHAIIACGSGQLSWDIFRRSIFVLQQLSSKLELETPWASSHFTPEKEFIYSTRLLMVKELCEPILSRPFYSRTRSVLRSICSDPRDRVYALLSIHEQGRLIDEMKLEIRPNYDAAVSQVYQQLAREHINQDQSLQILELCELRRDNPHNLPSWVPDISRERLTKAINGHYTAGRTFPVYGSCAAGTLHVRGRSMCSLQTTNSLSLVLPTNEDILQALFQLRPPMSIEAPYVAGGSFRNAYCDALSAGSFIDKYQRDSFKQLLEKIWNTDLGVAAGSKWTAPLAPGSFDLLNSVYTHCRRRTLCTTEQGYIVLAPGYAKRGDQVCVLLGCNSSMLLRPAGNRRKVVGECYVPGLTSGEALAGPLPKGYRKEMVFDESRRAWSLKFRNISNNETISEDPRFNSSEYPEIGSIVAYQRCTRQDKTGLMGTVQVRNLDDEARLAYPWREENLKKRGVLLRDFLLI
jgi:hypothetical protein